MQPSDWPSVRDLLPWLLGLLRLATAARAPKARKEEVIRITSGSEQINSTLYRRHTTWIEIRKIWR
jgi:hypothetical protein